VSQTGVPANHQSDAITHHTPKALRAKYVERHIPVRPAEAGVWECDASSHRFLVQERTLVSLVQFIFNTAA
jgi:hypothetical protein